MLDKYINDIEGIVIQICADLRPRSIVDKVKFQKLYKLLNDYRIIIQNEQESVPWSLIENLSYLSDSLIVQCNYSKTKEHLIIEWKLLNENILKLFAIENSNKQESFNLNNILISDEMEIEEAWRLFKKMYDLIINSDLILTPQKYEELGTLHETDNKYLLEYWELRNIVHKI
jgi:hypothetical protein